VNELDGWIGLFWDGLDEWNWIRLDGLNGWVELASFVMHVIDSMG